MEVIPLAQNLRLTPFNYVPVKAQVLRDICRGPKGLAPRFHQTMTRSYRLNVMM